MIRAFRATMLLTALTVSAASSRAQSPNGLPPLPPLPTTGVDYSGIDEFYRIADILVKDADPTEAEWTQFLTAPGYRLLAKQSRAIRQQMTIAFKPSRTSARHSLMANEEDARTLGHLIRAYEQRDDVMKTTAALERSIGDSIALAVRAAARYLPKGTVESHPPPFIGFAVFGDDGLALEGGVLLDPLYVKEEGLVALISHEFHHVYTGSLDRTIRASGPPPYDLALALALMHLRNEGIADQIDKPHPLPAQHGALSWYPPRYNDVYDRTPDILKSIDTLLIMVSDDSTRAAGAGARARTLLWSNSHPNGAYMAREIVETFGIDSLMPSIYNPWAFLRTYAAAEANHGRPAPFSPKSVALLGAMERRYLRTN